jgi:hypothetical protein
MATYTKKILSGSTDGKGVKVVATATPGTVIHTGPTSTTTLQEIWLWAQNNHTADVILTIEFGDATAPDHNIITSISSKAGLSLISPGLIIQGNATALTIKAFAATTNVISIIGFVNEIA